MARGYCLSRKAAVSERRRGALAFRPMGAGASRARRRSLLAICASDGGSPETPAPCPLACLASLNRDASFHGRLGVAAGLLPDAIASHAEPAEVKAAPREADS
jgi:hypothetical protein